MGPRGMKNKQSDMCAAAGLGKNVNSLAFRVKQGEEGSAKQTGTGNPKEAGQRHACDVERARISQPRLGANVARASPSARVFTRFFDWPRVGGVRTAY
jgi:hypothetical protein